MRDALDEQPSSSSVVGSIQCRSSTTISTGRWAAARQLPSSAIELPLLRSGLKASGG